MGNFSLGNIALETIFGLIAVFLFFAPSILDWSNGSYLGGLLFLGLAFAVLKIKHK